MRFNLKIKTTILLAVFSVFFLPMFCSAANFGLTEAGNISGLKTNKISEAGSIPSMLGDVVSIVLSLVGIFFFILVLYAGFTWMTAAGSAEKVGKAKSILMSGAIGLVIVLSAYTISSYVFREFLAGSFQAGEGTGACKTAVDGQSCGDNQVCLGKKCVTECVYEYGKTAKCGDPNDCKGVVDPGLCPGGDNNRCCVPQGVYESVHKVETGGSGASQQTPSEATSMSNCMEKGGMCIIKSACAYSNGKEEAVSCGAGQVCCVTCITQGGICFSPATQNCEGGTSKSGTKNGCEIGSNCCLGGFLKDI